MIRLSLNAKSGPLGVALGWLLSILGACMGAHGLFAWFLGDGAQEAFFLSAFLSIGLGGCVVFAFSGKRMVAFDLRQSFFLTLASWSLVSLFSALPLYFSHLTPSLMDAMFESVSALTTTGLSLYSCEAYFCNSLKFWMVFLQWLGGFGLVMTALILLPILRTGGSQLMSAESSDQSDKIAPRSSTMAAHLGGVYVIFTIFITLCLRNITHLPWWDSITYGMATISTGGIAMSTYNVLDLSWQTKGILSLGMMMGSMTLVLCLGALRGNWKALWRDDQLWGMIKILALSTVGISLWHKKNPLIDGIFMSVSAVSGTGFPAESIFHFGGLFWIVTLLGGCSGSASGGIKIFRMQIIYRMAKNHVLRCLNPWGFYPTVYNGRRLESLEIEGVMSVVFFYLAGWVLSTMALTGLGHELSDAFTLASSTLTNSGLPLGPWADHVNTFSSGTKWVCMMTMLCGRFECVTLVGALCSLFRR